jgi:hypothetical protein
MLALYKITRITLGELDTKEYSDIKSNIRTICELPVIKDKSTAIKCTPEDLYAFYHQSCSRYPTFTPISPSDKISNPITITASNQLTKAMGLLKASKNIDLPYQTLFPSKNQQNQQQQQQQQNNTKKQENNTATANILPFTENSSIEPFSLTEASSVWLNHLYISIANYQIICEREKAVNRWQRWNNEKNQNDEKEAEDEWKHMIYNQLQQKEMKKMNEIEQLYESIVPHFQSIVVVALKLLLSTVSIGKDKEAEILEDINITRNRETISKAVSGILLLLLKWFKTCRK